MNTSLDSHSFDDVLLFVDDPDAVVAQWSLDELDRSADLGSVRSAWAGADAFDD